MKIALVSTYPPRQCGIATYARKLTSAMAELESGDEFVVLSEEGGSTLDHRTPCISCFSRGTDYGAELVEQVIRHRVDVVHFQHAPDIFGVGTTFLDTLAGLKFNNVAVVVTMHTVFTRASGILERKPFMVGFHKNLGRVVDSVVVHGNRSRDILVSHGIPRYKVSCIAHGTDDAVAGDPRKGREILGLTEEDTAILFFGFIHVQKNIGIVIKALPEIAREVPNVKFVVAGKVAGGTWYNRIYLNHLKRLVKSTKMQDRVSIVDSFIPDENVPDIHAAAELMVMPHSQGYGSASGVVHNALTMRLPMICSDSIKFEEVGANISKDLLVKTHDKKAWAKAVIRALKDERLHEEITAKIEQYANETLWSQVGKQHLELYKNLRGT